MNAWLYDRLAATLSVLFLVALTAGTYYLTVWATRDESNRVVTQSNEPDVFVEQVSLTRLNSAGTPIFQMSAESMRHFPIDGSSLFARPYLVSLDPDRPKVTVRADVAHANEAGDQTVLTGNVVLKRQAIADNDSLVVRASRMTIDGNSELARSSARVRVHHGQSRLTAVGMKFDNLSGQLHLLSQVRAYWPGSAPMEKK